MRENELLCLYLAAIRLLLMYCLAPPVCEELPKGQVAFITRGGEEEGKRKDIAAIVPQSLNKSFCCGVEEQDCLLLATETRWLFDDSSNIVLHSGRGKGGHLAEGFTGFVSQGITVNFLRSLSYWLPEYCFGLFHSVQEETATHWFILIVTGFAYLSFNRVQFLLQAQIVFLQVTVVERSNIQ